MTRGSAVALGDGVAGLRSLPAGSVRLICTDLPSGETRAAFDTAPDLASFWSAAWAALAADGTVVVIASSLRFASNVIASQSTAFRYDLVWHKSLATGHLNARTRPLRAHEFVLVFARQLGTYNPQRLAGASPIHAARRLGHGENYGKITRATDSRAGATDRYPVSVLNFASVGTSARERVHPQQKPVPLLQWIVRTYTSPGDLVADPFAGSGSTGRACDVEGRRFVGWDSSPRFGCAVATPQR